MRPPPRFGDFVGQGKTVSFLRRQLDGALARGEAFPHTLFIGPSGTGKTLLARSLATEFGSRLVEAMGYEDRNSLIKKMLLLNVGDFLFIDEAHRLGPLQQELFYLAIDLGSVPNAPGQREATDGGGDGRVTLKPWTLVLATDQPGSLLDALRKRMIIEIALPYYSAAEMKEIVENVAMQLSLLVSPQAARKIAEIANGLPRRAKQLLQNLRLFHPHAEKGQVGQKELQEFLTAAGYDARGLTTLEQRYMELIPPSGGASLESLALTLGVDTNYVRREIEAPLVRRALVRITPLGRQLTERGRGLLQSNEVGTRQRNDERCSYDGYNSRPTVA
jgi:Holliday junction DNA helicase RuvB